MEGVPSLCACGVDIDELERVCRDCGLDEDQQHFEAMDHGQRFERILPPRRAAGAAATAGHNPAPHTGSRR